MTYKRYEYWTREGKKFTERWVQLSIQKETY